jgi:hypothetical protein
MSMGDNNGNGGATAQDRFSGGVSAFRQGRREAALAADGDDTELPTRTPHLHRPLSQPLSPQPLSQPLSPGLEPTGALERAAGLPALDLQGLSEPVFPSNGWLDAAPAESMADHPLLRGLLQELPARGAMPASDWLDRWFEAARSILELLYVQEAKRS